MRSHFCVLGSCLACPMSQIHAIILLCLGLLFGWFLWVKFMRSYSCSWVLFCFVLWVRITRSHSCVLGACLLCLRNTTHAATLLCPGFLSGLSSGLNSFGPSPGSFLVCLAGQVHAVPLLCPGFLSGLFSGSFTWSHSCLLSYCQVCVLGQLHAVLLLCLGFLFMMVLDKAHAVLFLFLGLVWFLF